MKKLLIITVLFVAFVSCDTAPKNASNKITSYVMAQDMIRGKFRFPEEVKFDQRSLVHEASSPGQCVLTGFVTAKNALGITSRYIYEIWLTYSGGDWADSRNWSYSRLIIKDVATGKQETFIGKAGQPYTPPAKADKRRRTNRRSKTHHHIEQKTYQYIEIIDDQDLWTGRIVRKDESPREILAASDSAAYLEAYKLFCIAVKVNNDLKELLGGTHSTPVGFRLLNEQRVDISRSVSFATQEQQERKIEEMLGITKPKKTAKN
jgi:hypothetical protein